MFDTIRMGAAGAGEAYEIERSLRFNSVDSAYLTRTPGSDGNLRVWTFSCWVKRANVTLDTIQTFFSAGSNNPDTIIKINVAGQFEISTWSGSGYVNQVTSTQSLRDPASWYHLVGAVDTTQGTASNRVKMYVNGTQITDFANSSYPSQNYDYLINDASYAHYIGRHPGGQYFDGYITEFHFVDGTQLTPSSFGKTNAATGQWIPKEYEGSHGTNGFYLNFSDNSNTTSSTLGDDDSANSNDWTPNNLSVAAGEGCDSMVDTPTNNYPTLNPLHWNTLNDAGGLDNGPQYSEGNLKMVANSSATSPYTRSSGSTMVVNSGAWYFEVYIETQNNGWSFGAAHSDEYLDNGGWDSHHTWNPYDQYRYYPGGGTTYGDQAGVGNTVACAVDIDNNTIEWFKNNVSQGEITGIGISGKPVVLGLKLGWKNIEVHVNFGQRPFAYTPPTGFLPLCNENLPEPPIKLPTKHFGILPYSSGSSNGTFTFTDSSAVDFFPDLTWIRCRSDGEYHWVMDVVRGNVDLASAADSKWLNPNFTIAEGCGDIGGGCGIDGTTVSAIQNGIKIIETSVSAAENGGEIYFENRDYVTWNWEGGGSTVTNDTGSIDSQVNANPTAGFSIATYSGDGAAGSSTVGHGLGVAPEMVIIKRRDTTGDWIIGHKGLASSAFANNKFLKFTGDDIFDNSLVWGSEPTSTVTQITTGSTAGNLNVSGGTYVMYSFASVAGYSKLGSYTGNGLALGPFIYTGFRPAWLMLKRFDSDGEWNILDVTRNVGEQPLAREIRANLNNAESNYESTRYVDFLSNGFKLRTTDTDHNGDGATYVYMAFAETPFKYANAR